LAKEHAESRFDAIVDTVGIQELYSNSPRYLREGGRFVNIGAMQVQSANGSLLAFAWNMILNLILPVWLGGTPRSYQMIMGTPGVDVMARVKRFAEDGVLVPVIDSTWEMEDALKVCSKIVHFASHI
jgi:NADPH:quinone reductase-like Zn-dependent oxidoreductase